ncbi:PH domain-containing protein [Arenibacter sp. GZD96]|uniref:PH domain-containing protein n=1 Tax=Aurantibrevibacter litoralis TaxID=3106030 RepID=UPI002AFF0EFE|nr:PH domain-containing protein [Arenibacter sp. GZD-96]MEA1786262.1 PH domain-containing protein [Arenibacter sp. GZD-96]
MKFDSKKDVLFTMIMLGINAFLIGITITGIWNGEMVKDEYWALIPVLALVGLLLWLYFGTGYELSKENGLVYKSGPFNGKIKVERITEIIKGKTLWVGFRPATSRKGLIIKYDRYNDLYISPKTNESFIEKILELNADIKITE